MFVHFSSIDGVGYRTLQEGEEVEFVIATDPKGPRAEGVRPGWTQDEDEVETESEAAPVPTGYGLAIIDGRVRVVELFGDGGYRVVDGSDEVAAYVHFVVSGAASPLLEALEELEWLIGRHETTEAELQAFFERHPELLLGSEYTRAHPQVVLARDDDGQLIPDFVLEPMGSSELCDILDLKLPQEKLVVREHNRERFAASVLRAAAQLREYRDYFDDPRHRERVREAYGFTAYRPTTIVIIGRDDPSLSPVKRQAIKADVAGLEVLTYDDITRRGRVLAQRLGGK